jgi:hypothetical protein
MTETTNQTALSAGEADVASAESGAVAADREIKQIAAQIELAKANARISLIGGQMLRAPRLPDFVT